ncbi:MAG: hypothetical protein AAGI68_01130 [Planctomycetota bacterium]
MEPTQAESGHASSTTSGSTEAKSSDLTLTAQANRDGQLNALYGDGISTIVLRDFYPEATTSGGVRRGMGAAELYMALQAQRARERRTVRTTYELVGTPGDVIELVEVIHDSRKGRLHSRQTDAEDVWSGIVDRSESMIMTSRKIAPWACRPDLPLESISSETGEEPTELFQVILESREGFMFGGRSIDTEREVFAKPHERSTRPDESTGKRTLWPGVFSVTVSRNGSSVFQSRYESAWSRSTPQGRSDEDRYFSRSRLRVVAEGGEWVAAVPQRRIVVATVQSMDEANRFRDAWAKWIRMGSQKSPDRSTEDGDVFDASKAPFPEGRIPVRRPDWKYLWMNADEVVGMLGADASLAALNPSLASHFAENIRLSLAREKTRRLAQAEQEEAWRMAKAQMEAEALTLRERLESDVSRFVKDLLVAASVPTDRQMNGESVLDAAARELRPQIETFVKHRFAPSLSRLMKVGLPDSYEHEFRGDVGEDSVLGLIAIELQKIMLHGEGARSTQAERALDYVVNRELELFARHFKEIPHVDVHTRDIFGNVTEFSIAIGGVRVDPRSDEGMVELGITGTGFLTPASVLLLDAYCEQERFDEAWKLWKKTSLLPDRGYLSLGAAPDLLLKLGRGLAFGVQGSARAQKIRDLKVFMESAPSERVNPERGILGQPFQSTTSRVAANGRLLAKELE